MAPTAVRVVLADTGADPFADRVLGEVAAHLERSPLFEVADRDGRPARVRVSRPVEAQVEGLRIDVRVEDPAAPSGAWEAAVEVFPAEGRALEPADLSLAAGRAVAVLEARRLLASGQREHIGRILTADDPKLVALALEWIRDHAPGAYVDAMPPLLASGDPGVVRLAAEVVGRAGDPAYVSVLLDAAGRAAEGPRRAIYDALGRIGGDRAERFLAFAARNEADDELARAARHALRRARGGPGPGLSADARPLRRRGQR